MLVGIFSLVICVIIVMGVMTPIVSDWTTGERIENEDAGWLRMNYTESPSYQSIAADLSGEGVVIYNDSDGTPEGTETLSGTEDTIIYADNNLALWYENDTLFLLGQIDEEPIFVQRNDAISLIRESDGIRVSATDTPTITFPFPTYAYEPNSDGKYAFFTKDTPVKMESGKPNAIIGGGNVGVYAYNDIYRYNGLGLYMHPVYDDDGQLYDAYWDKTAPVESQSLDPDALDPSAINLTPMDIDLDPITLNPGASLMAMPTPTYTDGDWGFDVISGTTNAKIVSYSGGAGNIVIPSTVSSGGVTYTVTQIGKDTYNEVFDNSTITGSTIEIPDTVTYIATYAFNNCSGFTGALVIPASVKSIGQSTFQGCTGFTSIEIKGVETLEKANTFQGCTGLKGDLILPDTLTMLNGSYVFGGCTGLTGTLVIPNSVTTLGGRAFQGSTFEKVIIASDGIPNSNNPLFLQMTSVPEVLDLSETVDYSVTRSGLPSTATIYDTIGDCFGYISFAEIVSDPVLTGPIATLLIAVPLLMVVGLSIAAMSVMRGRVQ